MSQIRPSGNRKPEHKIDREYVTMVDLPNLDDVPGANPEEDARKSIEAGDYRFAGVWSFYLDVPDVPWRLVDKYGKKGVWGTGCVRNPQQQPLYDAARKYVRKYNDVLMKRIEAKRTGTT